MSYEPSPAGPSTVTLVNGQNDNVPIGPGGSGNDFGHFIILQGPTDSFQISGFDISGVPPERRAGHRLVVCFGFLNLTMQLLADDDGSADANQILPAQAPRDDKTPYSHDTHDGYTLELIYGGETLPRWMVIGSLPNY